MVFTDDELLNPVKASLEKIRPYLLGDGGDLELVKIDQGKVYITLQGACKGCPSSTLTLKNKIQYQLRLDIHPEIEVIQVKQ